MSKSTLLKEAAVEAKLAAHASGKNFQVLWFLVCDYLKTNGAKTKKSIVSFLYRYSKEPGEVNQAIIDLIPKLSIDESDRSEIENQVSMLLEFGISSNLIAKARRGKFELYQLINM